METRFLVEAVRGTPANRAQVEIVERKGLGHPDTMCDSIAEAVSQELCRTYLDVAGRVLHYNADKALLVAGTSEPRLGGGRVLEPMRLILGDRATARWNDEIIPIGEIAANAARSWMSEHLRFLDPREHLQVESALHPGSAQLTNLYEPGSAGANDTSVGVGYAPLTETERLVLAAEQTVNGVAFKQRFPEAGEDVKVMGVRVDRRLELTLAVAFVDRFVASERSYVTSKEAMREQLTEELGTRLSDLDSLEIVINALDRPERGAAGMYLTVLGTSAEGGDSGEVGRGNRVNGLISFHRPHSLEAAAGKNSVRHVGKIYNLLARDIAERVHVEVEGVEEVAIFLCSRIGCPVEKPWIASARLALVEGVGLPEVAGDVRSILERELAGTPEFIRGLVRGEARVC